MSAGSFDDSIICLLHLVTALYSSESLYANYMSGSIVDYLKWVSRPSQRSFLASDSFIHSSHFYSAPSSPLLLRGAPDYSTDTISEFHAEAHRQQYCR